jgi:xylan 1,4-beta-xylosidase
MAEAHAVARGIAGRADIVVVSVDCRLCPVPAKPGGTVDGRVEKRRSYTRRVACRGQGLSAH